VNGDLGLGIEVEYAGNMVVVEWYEARGTELDDPVTRRTSSGNGATINLPTKSGVDRELVQCHGRRP